MMYYEDVAYVIEKTAAPMDASQFFCINNPGLAYNLNAVRRSCC